MKTKYIKILFLLVVFLMILGTVTTYAQGVPNTITTATNVVAQDLQSQGVAYRFQVGIPGIVKAGQLLPIRGFGNLINKIITLAYRISMLLVLFKLVEIGFKYMTSKGNTDIVASVSKGMKNLLIGILILFGSYIILRTINPDLTKFPNNINCPAGAAECDGPTSTKITETIVTCPVAKLDSRTADDIEGGVGVGSSNSTSDNGTTPNDINDYINNNSDAFDNSNDWAVAKGDLKSGQTSNNVWTAIKKLTDNRSVWLDEASCSIDLNWGPIFNSHVKVGDYASCHDTYDAIDLVVNDKKGEGNAACMRLALKYLRDHVPEVVACDEINCPKTTPHIHIQDVNCDVASCRVCL